MSIDYAKLREQTLGSGLDEEAVTVNTRALIDKVLARYSGEWTTLRELIQNAADAAATKVSIRFETSPSTTIPTPSSNGDAEALRHVIQHHTLKRLLVSNNGQPFGENDWQRLKRIAEGNPDETKIGAFGVGFYSVFADCETPFVTSGNQTMAFYWKGNSLFTRRGNLTKEQTTGDTCFLLDYRNAGSPIPGLISLCQFLSTSLTFVGLEGIELWFDRWNILTLTKKSAPPASIKIPADINPRTKEGLMGITTVESQNAQIDGKWLNVVAWNRQSDFQSQSPVNETGPPAQAIMSFFSRLTTSTSTNKTAAKKLVKEEQAMQRTILDNLATASSATVFLRVTTVGIQTFVSKQLAAELERATKKPPPKTTRIAILTSSFDEMAASMASSSGLTANKASDIFVSVLPSKNGRIFIGFPTAQTTGLLAHISAPSVIPTVERESIDLNARYVRTWNVEMLRVAGIACRVSYVGDMLELSDRITRSLRNSDSKKIEKQHIDAVLPAAIHNFKQYTFQESTPSSQVGQLIEEAFWTCSQKASINILSSRGVLPSDKVRLISEDLSFVDGIPVIPDEVVKQAPAFVNKIQGYGLITDITTQDIKKELEAQALSEVQLIELLKWAGLKLERNVFDTSAVRILFDGTVTTMSDESTKSFGSPVLLLGNIETYPNISKLPSDMPMRTTTIPFQFIKSIPKSQLEAFGWSELQIVPWLRFILERGSTVADQDMTLSPTFASQILPVLSKAWDGLSQNSKATVAELLMSRTVIPTKLGMKRPSQAYFSSVKLFDDLPTIQGLNGVKEKFLGAIGVRKTVELSVVFGRLMCKQEGSPDTKWSLVDLLKYLVSVRDDIPDDEMNKLRLTPICPAETAGGKTDQLFCAFELFEPKPQMRDLGLPVLYWQETFRSTTPEAKLLFQLGLKPYPNVPDLVRIMVESARAGNSKRYDAALIYLIANNITNKYRGFAIGNSQIPFLPLQDHDLSSLVKPQDCFVNKACAVLKFKILRADLHAHAGILGVQQDPPILLCRDRLFQDAPRTRADAKAVFGYFAGRLNEIAASSNLAEQLGQAKIVPVLMRGSKSDTVKLVSANSCFLGDSQIYGDIFDFVDFGSEANAFLLKIGSKSEPNAVELAYMMVREPSRLLVTLGPEKYLNLIRRLAENVNSLKSDKTLWSALKSTSCLIAVREVSSSKKNESVVEQEDIDVEDAAAIKEYSLSSAPKMVLADDYDSYRRFRDKLLTAPQDEVFESFYSSLGTPWLSSLVDTAQSMGPLLKDQIPAEELQKLIAQRCRLFLVDHSADALRHDAKWIENTLLVKATSSLTLRRTLRGYNASYTNKLTAALHRESKKDATLFVTSKVELYEVSRALMPLLLKRPRQQDFLALEMILTSNLQGLKRKGYNVDRILRKKEEDEQAKREAKRLEDVEEENRRLGDEEKRWKQAQSQSMSSDISKSIQPGSAKDKSIVSTNAMPGAFGNPEEQPLLKNPSAESAMPIRNSFLSNIGNISKQLGFNVDDKLKSIQQHLDRPTSSSNSNQGNSQPQEQQQQMEPYTDSPSFPTPSQPNQPELITPPAILAKNLLSAIQSSRPHSSNSLFSPPSTSSIKEQSSYCDSRPSQNLSFVATTSSNLKFYFSNDILPSTRSEFLSSNVEALERFSTMLVDLATNIYSMRKDSIHVYYDDHGASIAFNTAGSVFCNLRYFIQLHWTEMNNAGNEDKVAWRNAMMYWYVTIAHELAHNLVAEHSSQHGFYTESYVTMFHGKLMQRLLG